MTDGEWTYEDYLREKREELNRNIQKPEDRKVRKRVYKVRVEFPDVIIARRGGDV